MTDSPEDRELRVSPLAAPVAAAYPLLGAPRRWGVAKVLLRIAQGLEGGAYRSATTRRLLARYHGVRVGAHTHGDCLLPGAFPPSSVVGRYTSVGVGVRAFNQNHPVEHLSIHPYFYEPALGHVVEEYLPRHELRIGSDVWLGQNVLITPGCRRIGDGAIVGAGAVVTRDVEDFAVVAGVPARVLRPRFEPRLRELVAASRWWRLPLDEVLPHLEAMRVPLEDVTAHPLLAPRPAGEPTEEPSEAAR